jgi:hypothetical protein
MNGQASETIKNVVPKADGYGPLNGLEPFSDALGGVCRGAKLALDSTGAAHVMAGTATGLFKLSSVSWTDTSGGSAPYNLVSGDWWSFAQHVDDVVASNINDPMQTFALLTDTDFSDLAGSPPQAKWIWTESGYLTAGNLAASARTVRRSGYKDITFWTTGQRGADQQELTDGGVIQGAASDEVGSFLFQERKVRRLQNRPGEEVSFALSDVDPTRGTVAPLSIVQVGSMIEFFSEDGFYRLGNPSAPIGAERVDTFFLDDVDLDRLYDVQGVADPIRKMNWWRYSSQSNASLDYTDRLVGHHWYLEDRWVYAELNLEWLLAAATPGYTLEEMETTLGYATLEDIPYSLDSRVWKGGRPAFAAFDSDHKLGFFEGDALEALLETADIPLGGEKRTQVNGFRPVGDVSGAYGSIGVKETLHGTPSFGSESTQNGTGLIPLRGSGRTTRFRLRIPAATVWTTISGIEVPREAIRQAGRR